MNNEKKQLKSELRTIWENQCKLADEQNAWEYVLRMLDYIGDSDPELRDDLIYEIFCEWIDERELFNEEQLRYILAVLMDDQHLFYQIGSEEDDSVFTRTFSVLVVVQILSRHRKKAFLSMDEFTSAKNKLIAYYTLEKDLRGYTQQSGWAHAAAHGADALDELIQCRECSEDMVKEVLDAVKKIMYNGKYIFHNEEDERIGNVVLRVIRGNLLSRKDIIQWLEALTECTQWQYGYMQYSARVNCKNLIRCLYFRVIHSDSASDLTDALLQTERKLNRFIRIDGE